MAVGGMVGGGLFSTLGAVVGIAGAWAWLSFAAFSTGSAINATLAATARLACRVAEDGELPAALDHKNAKGDPDRAVILLGAAAAVLAATGTLTSLVEAASLSLLFTVAVVCGLALLQRAGLRVAAGFGALAGATAAAALGVRLIRTDPMALVFLGVLMLVALFGRPLLLRHVKTDIGFQGLRACRLGLDRQSPASDTRDRDGEIRSTGRTGSSCR